MSCATELGNVLAQSPGGFLVEPSFGARLEDGPYQSGRPVLMWQGLDRAIVRYFASFDKT